MDQDIQVSEAFDVGEDNSSLASLGIGYCLILIGVSSAFSCISMGSFGD